MSVTLTVLKSNVILTINGAALSLRALVDADTVRGHIPGAVGLSILELTDYTTLKNTLGVIDYLQADAIAANRDAALARSISAIAGSATSSGDTYLQADAIATARVGGFMKNLQFQTTSGGGGATDPYTVVTNAQFFGA